MKITEAFNYMKKIINNGKKNNYSVNNVRNGINEYIDTLVEQKAISFKDKKTLMEISAKLKEIMESKITADEVFVEALSKADKVDYVSCTDEEKTVATKVSTKKTTKSKSKAQKVKEYEGNPWDYLPVEPGSCGKTWDFQRRTQWEEMHKPKEIDYSRCGRFW